PLLCFFVPTPSPSLIYTLSLHDALPIFLPLCYKSFRNGNTTRMLNYQRWLVLAQIFCILDENCALIFLQCLMPMRSRPVAKCFCTKAYRLLLCWRPIPPGKPDASKNCLMITGCLLPGDPMMNMLFVVVRSYRTVVSGLAMQY